MIVVSYNLHHGEGLDRRFDLPRLAAVIQSARPDLVALQEVDRGTRRSGGVDQAAELARLTGLTMVYGPAIEFDGGRYGNAVLTRYPVVGQRCVPLPSAEPRVALGVTVRVPAGGAERPLCFIVTHLDLTAAARLAAVPLIEALCADDPDQPAILAGDLNDPPASATLRAFERTWTNATAGAGLWTVPADAPREQIDYVLCRPAGRWRVRAAAVLPEAVASDHRPICAELDWLPDDCPARNAKGRR